MRRHGFSWPSPHAHNLSTNSNLTLALTNPLSPPFPPPSTLAPFPPYRTISIVEYVRVHLTNIRCSSVTYVAQEGISTAFSHPLPLSHVESGHVPCASSENPILRYHIYPSAGGRVKWLHRGTLWCAFSRKTLWNCYIFARVCFWFMIF